MTPINSIGKRRRVGVIIGTRPDALKLAPVIAELKRRRGFEVLTCSTGQHREMLEQVLALFRLAVDVDFDIMVPAQSLAYVASSVLRQMESFVDKYRPDAILVQGDTTTAFAAALGSFYCGVRVGHVEAGLRTHDRFRPFPEEMNRRLTAPLADFHFAPTETGRRNLLREGIPGERIWVTGNTIVDALNGIVATMDSVVGHVTRTPGLRLILVTAHRRESFGEPLRNVCRALRTIVDAAPDVEVLYPVHPNPNVTAVVRDALVDTERIRLIEPLDYAQFVCLMRQATMVISDSGGVQEEAPVLGVPVLVTRDVTERPEGVEAGAATLVGTDPERIVDAALKILSATHQGIRLEKLYGDGHAAEKIVGVLEQRLVRL